MIYLGILVQWHLDITKVKGLAIFFRYKEVSFISRYFSIYLTITGVKKIVRYTEDVIIYIYIYI